MRLLLDLYLDYAPDDHAWQVLSDVHRMLGLAQYASWTQPAPTLDRIGGSNSATTSPAYGQTSSTPSFHLGLAEHRRRHRG